MGTLLKRLVVLIPAVMLQGLWLFLLTEWLAPFAGILTFLLSIFAGIIVIYIITKHDEGAYKILWLLVILMWPIPGTVLYLLFGNRKTGKPLHVRLEKAKMPRNETVWNESNKLCDEIEREDKRFAQTMRAIQRVSTFPVFRGKGIKYYPIGEELYARMIEELKTAESQIMAEYFIVESGKMWDSMVEIMSEKVKQGVEVRVMYDDLGSISTYSAKELKNLRAKGIKCIRFNPIVGLHGTANYRDHRKMLIIDGRIAFSGGVNIADEYINEKEKYGHWKDIGFCIEGKAVLNYARMFAEFWNAFSDDKISEDRLLKGAARILEVCPTTLLTQDSESKNAEECCETNSANVGREEEGGDGYVLSYYDSPVAVANISNDMFIDLLAQATDYAWFYTPYLLLGESLQEAFVNAARRGVDVRIIVPGIPDKKMVFRMTRSYYGVLMEAGVRIYEYTPGFIHAKASIIDDKVATVGTVNLDYRSLFLHYENNTIFYKTSLLQDLKADFIKTQNLSYERTKDNIKGSLAKWLFDGLLRILAPLC